MKEKFLFFLFLTTFLTSCSHFSKEDPVIEKHGDDLVTVRTAIDLAKQSYLMGCMAAHHLYSDKKQHQNCLKQAEQHVEVYIYQILNQ